MWLFKSFKLPDLKFPAGLAIFDTPFVTFSSESLTIPSTRSMFVTWTLVFCPDWKVVAGLCPYRDLCFRLEVMGCCFKQGVFGNDDRRLEAFSIDSLGLQLPNEKVVVNKEYYCTYPATEKLPHFRRKKSFLHHFAMSNIIMY